MDSKLYYNVWQKKYLKFGFKIATYDALKSLNRKVKKKTKIISTKNDNKSQNTKQM